MNSDGRQDLPVTTKVETPDASKGPVQSLAPYTCWPFLLQMSLIHSYKNYWLILCATLPGTGEAVSALVKPQSI